MVVRYQQEHYYLARTQKKPLLESALPQQASEPIWLTAVHAADSKQAKEIRVLDLREVTSFAEILVTCTGNNARQIQTIVDEIELQLKDADEYPLSIEGYTNAEWILMDYGACVINVFSEKARAYYDLERLWRDGKPLTWEPAAGKH